MIQNKYIVSDRSLVTTHEETRTGFLTIALEKNKVGDPYVKSALAFKVMVKDTCRPEDLLNLPKIRPFLVTAAGLSDKSLKYLTEHDQMYAIQELIEKFLIPAGADYIDEVVYRYLLIKGDTVGGAMRNKIGSLGQEKLIRSLYSSMSVRGLSCSVMQLNSNSWKKLNHNNAGEEANVTALSWINSTGPRILLFNTKIPIVNKNVDMCLFLDDQSDFNKTQIVKQHDRAIMFAELKGGIDPAGADEHWKTGNTALNRIRTAFDKVGCSQIKTAFIAGAIESSMATEIYNQLNDGMLTNAANLTKHDQIIELCDWLIDL